jgi:predicted dithiol-disulfide oxidoreductase (DUF899 family)
MKPSPIISKEKLRRAHEALPAKEKEATGTRRGVEALGNDLTPFGRQETWEDSPLGYRQTPPYEWWRSHDAYGVQR